MLVYSRSVPRTCIAARVVLVILEDFVMLGTTVPEPNSDGRVFVCSAGVSAEYGGLVRIYPLARRNVPRRWHMYRVPLELNCKDSRPASYKVTGNRSPGAHEQINREFELVSKVEKRQQAELLRPFRIGSIREANEKRLSLAVIEPEELELFFEHNPTSPDSPQLALFPDLVQDKVVAGAKRFPFIPRLRFRDEAGEHRLMLRDWGCYEWMRKYPDRRDELAKCLHLSPNASSLFIGNMNHRRNSWLVISVLNGIRDAPALFSNAEKPAMEKKRKSA